MIDLKPIDILKHKVLSAISIGIMMYMASGAWVAPDASVYEQAVVRVVNDKMGSGTGFFITSAGHVLTNEHVIDRKGRTEESAFAVIHPKTEDIDKARVESARLVWKNKQLDLAVLIVESGNAPLMLDLEEPIVKKGTPVYALGYPGLQDQMADKLIVESSVTNGEVVLSQERPWGGNSLELTVLTHTAKVNPGNSGGPLINDCGRVVGVNTQISIVDKLQNYSYASAISESIRELEAQNISPTVINEYCEPGGESGANWVSMLNTAGIILLAALLGLLLLKQPRQLIIDKTRKSIVDLSRSRPPIKAQPKLDRAPSPPEGPPVKPGPPSVPQLVLNPQTVQANRVDLRARELAAQRHGLSFGRQSDIVDHALSEPGVSRRHFRISFASNAFFIEDLNSANGTKVNGKPLKPYYGRALADGDTVEVGSVVWLVAIG